MYTRRQLKAYEKATAFQEELQELIIRHLGQNTDAMRQTSILAALVAEAARGAYESGLPMAVVMAAVESIYAEGEAAAARPKS